MGIQDIKNIILQGEGVSVEFKRSFNRQAIETLVAFANSRGGKILVGVTDNKSIVGIDITKEAIQIWQNEIKTKTEPSIYPDIKLYSLCKKTPNTALFSFLNQSFTKSKLLRFRNFESLVFDAFLSKTEKSMVFLQALYTIDNKIIVSICIREYPVKPVSFRGRYYIRKNNSNHLLSVSEINDIYFQSIQTSWDSYPYAGGNLLSLDTDKISHFIEKVNQSGRFKLVGNSFECLRKLRFVKDDIPTNASMLLFSKEELFYNVHIGRFKAQSHIIDDKMVRGTLYEVVDNTMTYIISHLKVAFEITGKTSQRTEIFEYPLPALREIVLNAIIHRDYKSPTDIQIRIFDKEISVFNPGKLYGGLTIDDLKTDDYQAQSRNKLITEAFYLTKDIEKHGSGYRRIREYIKEYPSMYFDFEENSGGFLAKIGYLSQKLFEKTKDVGKGVTENVTENVTETRLNLIIELIKKDKNITTERMAEKLNLTKRTILRDIAKLKEANIIQYVGSAKTGYWEIIEKDEL